MPDLPPRFGNWNSVWRRFDRWCVSGIWEKLSAVLGGADLEELHLDSTSIKAQHAAAGSRNVPHEKKKKLTNCRCLDARVADGPPRSTRR